MKDVMTSPGMVAHTCNSSTRELEAEGAGVQGQPGLKNKVLLKGKGSKGGDGKGRNKYVMKKVDLFPCK
jgi:hypothetical protein